MICTIHRAQFVLAEADLLLQDAAIHVCDPGRISRIEPLHADPSVADVRVIDWGKAMIMPGLDGKNLFAQILEGAGECVATIVRGEIVWQRGEHVGSSATAA